MIIAVYEKSLRIIPEVIKNSSNGSRLRDMRDIVFIEEILCLKEDGDSIRLVRKSIDSINGVAYLETVPLSNEYLGIKKYERKENK